MIFFHICVCIMLEYTVNLSGDSLFGGRNNKLNGGDYSSVAPTQGWGGAGCRRSRCSGRSGGRGGPVQRFF